MDPVTRQRSVTLKVLDPYRSDPPLLPDQQVKVSFQGPSLANIIKAPASVLTEDGKVWTVQDKTLVLEKVELLNEQPDSLQIRFINQPDTSRLLVLYPLGAMLEGQRVSPKLTNDS
jgi:multidrug efflux pump subunit AcrA (membrane-fusion protein)